MPANMHACTCACAAAASVRGLWSGLEGVRHADDVFEGKAAGVFEEVDTLGFPPKLCTLDSSGGPFISGSVIGKCV